MQIPDTDNQLFDFSRELLLVDAREDDEIHLASQVVSAFARAVKASRYYATEHDLHQEFRLDLFKLLALFLERYHSLVLQISEREFSVQGRVLYACEDLKASIPFLFYRDGIRELRFVLGIDEGEIHGLMEVLKQCDSVNQEEDDLVTLLWEREFPHIDFQAVDVILEESGIIICESVEDFRAGQVVQPPAYDVEMAFGTMPNALPSLTTNRDLYRLTADDVQQLQYEVKTVTAPTAIFHTADMLLDLLPQMPDDELFHSGVDLLQQQLGEMFGVGEFRRISRLLGNITQLAAVFRGQPARSAMLQQISTRITEPQWRALLRARVTEQPFSEDEIRELLRLFPRQALPALLQMLNEPLVEQTRDTLLAMLTACCKDDLEALTPFLAHPRGQLARHTVLLLERIGEKRVVPYLEKACGHQEPRVREAVMRALATIPGAHAQRLLINALEDKESSIRSQAATALGQRKDAGALAALLTVVQSTGFREREPGEVKAVLTAVAQCGGNEALAILQGLVLQRSLFGRAKTHYIRTYAALALARIGTPEALAVLNKGQQSLDGTIREVCVQALNHPRRQAG